MEIQPLVTVLGSMNMDISVAVPRLPGAGETVLGGRAVFTPGGKGANQAVAAARLGARVRMAGCAGDDDFGRQLIASLRADGVDTRAVRITGGAPTGLAMIAVDTAGENCITVAPGANALVTPADALTACQGRGALVISAEIPLEAIAAALGRAAEAGLLIVLNLAPAPPRDQSAALVAAGPDWLVVNESEAAVILAAPVDGLASAAKAAEALVVAGARNAVVTAGSHGAALASQGARPVTVPGFTVVAVDSVGAGDTFTGALAAALAAGVPAGAAVRAAAAAGAAAVTRPGAQAAMPTPGDVLTITGHPWPITAEGDG